MQLLCRVVRKRPERCKPRPRMCGNRAESTATLWDPGRAAAHARKIAAMRFTLFWKLFLLQLLAAATLLGGALAVTRLYTIRSFAEYLETRERERVQEIAAELVEAYSTTGNLALAAQQLPRLRR